MLLIRYSFQLGIPPQKLQRTTSDTHFHTPRMYTLFIIEIVFQFYSLPFFICILFPAFSSYDLIFLMPGTKLKILVYSRHSDFILEMQSYNVFIYFPNLTYSMTWTDWTSVAWTSYFEEA